jgi:anti-anti-sigma factor
MAVNSREDDLTSQQARGDSRSTVVTLPATIDMNNAWLVGQELLAAFVAGVTTVVADLTGTIRCSAAGVHELALACQRAATRSVDLRLAIPAGEALHVFSLTGHDRWLPIYPSVAAAIAGGDAPPEAGRLAPG